MTNNSEQQVFFFKNYNGLVITGKEVRCFDWQPPHLTPKKVLEHDLGGFKNPPFVTTTNHDDELDIIIDKTNNKFLNFLINTSRIYWRKELRAGGELQFRKNRFNIESPALLPSEQMDQKQHLLNKLYAIGYLLHDYKDWEKPWAVYAMDLSKGVSEGTGKSVFFKALQYVQNQYRLDGRKPKLLRSDYIYRGVSPETNLILVDDISDSLDISIFFSEITGSLKVEMPGLLAREIPYKHSPKFAFTGPRLGKQDPSVFRRLLPVVFSDYYNQERSVKDDFDGKLLFENFSANDWNDMFWLFAYCVKFYLSGDKKINPPTF